MHAATTLIAAAAGFAINAAASPLNKRALATYQANVTLHESCNSNQTQHDLLMGGMADAMTLADFAKQCKRLKRRISGSQTDNPSCLSSLLTDVTTNGAEDPLFQKWFGQADYISVVGAYSAFLDSNKNNVTIRCDDIDGK